MAAYNAGEGRVDRSHGRVPNIKETKTYVRHIMGYYKDLSGVKIDPEAAGDAEMLQDMVLAAYNEAARKVDDETQKKTSGMLGGMGLPPGLI